MYGILQNTFNKINWMNNLYLYVVLCAICLTSCNKEVVKIEGKINSSKSESIELKIISKSKKCEKLLGNLQTKNGKFTTKTKALKPPFKIAMLLENGKRYETWIFRYGDFNFEILENELVQVNNSMENSEYDRICKTYRKMYFSKVKEKEEWIKKNKDLAVKDENKLSNYKKDIKKAYKLRKKSILSTFRKNPQNRIAMALLFDEYERLTTWQKEECLKNAQKYFSDCGINWQLRN
jgi:hypothetical protein